MWKAQSRSETCKCRSRQCEPCLRINLSAELASVLNHQIKLKSITADFLSQCKRHKDINESKAGKRLSNDNGIKTETQNPNTPIRTHDVIQQQRPRVPETLPGKCQSSNYTWNSTRTVLLMWASRVRLLGKRKLELPKGASGCNFRSPVRIRCLAGVDSLNQRSVVQTCALCPCWL